MSAPPLDDVYLEYLYDQVGVLGNVKSQTHWKLLRHLYTKKFVWLIPNDSNRAQDGIEIRDAFVQAYRRPTPAAWLYIECSVLEMLLGVAHRLSFEAEGEPREWFWFLMDNLDLSYYTDDHYDGAILDVDEKVETLLWRRYAPSGRGGLFPLQQPEADQRQIEIWYQMQAWLIEQD